MKARLLSILTLIAIIVVGGIGIGIGLFLSYYLLLLGIAVALLIGLAYILAILFPKTVSRIINYFNPNPIERDLRALMDAIDEELKNE